MLIIGKVTAKSYRIQTIDVLKYNRGIITQISDCLKAFNNFLRNQFSTGLKHLLVSYSYASSSSWDSPTFITLSMSYNELILRNLGKYLPLQSIKRRTLKLFRVCIDALFKD